MEDGISHRAIRINKSYLQEVKTRRLIETFYHHLEYQARELIKLSSSHHS